MSTVTSADGTIIDYDRYGAGPAVILIGGATQHRAVDENATAAARLLADEGCTAVDYDRRGRDRSGDTTPWHLDREVEDLAALIDAVGGPVTLYTSSSGATVALAAVSAGLDIAALALYEPPFFAGHGMDEDLATIRALLNEDDLDGAMRHHLTNVIGIPSDVVAGMSQSPVWPRGVAVARTLPYDLSAVHDINVDPDWTARWASVQIPVVVLSGDQTFPGLTKCADDVAAALPNATRQVLAASPTARPPRRWPPRSAPCSTPPRRPPATELRAPATVSLHSGRRLVTPGWPGLALASGGCRWMVSSRSRDFRARGAHWSSRRRFERRLQRLEDPQLRGPIEPYPPDFRRGPIRDPDADNI